MVWTVEGVFRIVKFAICITFNVPFVPKKLQLSELHTWLKLYRSIWSFWWERIFRRRFASRWRCGEVRRVVRSIWLFWKLFWSFRTGRRTEWGWRRNWGKPAPAIWFVSWRTSSTSGRDLRSSGPEWPETTSKSPGCTEIFFNASERLFFNCKKNFIVYDEVYCTMQGAVAHNLVLVFT